MNERRIAIFLPNLAGGGAERAMVNLAAGLAARGVDLDIVAAKAEGPYLPLLPKRARVVNMGVAHVRNSLAAMVRYLRRDAPSALLSHGAYPPWAHGDAGSEGIVDRPEAGVAPCLFGLRLAQILEFAQACGLRHGPRMLQALRAHLRGGREHPRGPPETGLGSALKPGDVGTVQWAVARYGRACVRDRVLESARGWAGPVLPLDAAF